MKLTQTIAALLLTLDMRSIQAREFLFRDIPDIQEDEPEGELVLVPNEELGVSDDRLSVVDQLKELQNRLDSK